MKSRIKFLASVIFWKQMLFKQRDQRPVFTTKHGQNQELLDIIESVYQRYFYVNAINKVFEYYLGQWKLNECKTICIFL